MKAPTPGALSVAHVAGLVLLQAILAATVIVTDRSLWIDEFATYRLADAASLASWLEHFAAWPNSDVQIPLFHFYMFVWGQAFGLSEHTMRLANVPLYVLAQLALFSTFRAMPRFVLVLFVISSFHPLLWYYLDDARPYVMVYLGATFMVCALVSLYAATAKPQPSPLAAHSPALLGAGVLVLASTTLLGVPWAATGILLALHLGVRADGGLAAHLRRRQVMYLVILLWMSILGAYYASTLLRGARATALFESDLKTLGYSIYELSGLAGLGPGRLELREGGTRALRAFLPLLVPSAVVLGGAIAYALRMLARALPRRDLLAIGAAALLPAVAIVGAGWVMHWRVVGRHLMPALPLVLLLLAYAVWDLSAPARTGAWRKSAATLIVVLLVFSGVSIRAPRHANADFRSAARLAVEAHRQGQVVWWSALAIDEKPYGLRLSGSIPDGARCPVFEDGARAINVCNLDAECFAGLPRPHLIVQSDPWLYDPKGALRAEIARGRFQRWRELPSFTLWRRPSEPPARAPGAEP